MQACLKSAESIDAHCACASGAIFSEDEDDVFTMFCNASDAECEAAVVALVVALDQGSFSQEELVNSLEEVCHNEMLRDCTVDCPAEVQEVIGDQVAFCSLDPATDLACLIDDCAMSAEFIAVHCACVSGMLFDDDANDFELAGDVFCLGSAACQGAAADYVVTLSPSMSPE